MAGKIEAEKVVFQDVFSKNFWFVVPVYQRSYVWQKDNISELVDDLRFAYEHKPESEYFLGSLVLKKLENKEYAEYDILDGQQRLTTFLLMMAVIRDLTKDDAVRETAQESIFQKENRIRHIPARVRIKYQIRDNIEELIEKLIQDKGTEDKNALEAYKKGSVSAVNIVQAVYCLREELAKIKDLDKFTEFLLNNALFIYVSTDNTEDAFRMFTILNDRGIPLTNADILKSENIGALKAEVPNSKESAKLETKYAKEWEEIEGKFEDKFDRFLQFIRTIYVKEKARTNLLDEFKEKIYAENLLKRGRETFEAIKTYSSLYSRFIDLEEEELSIPYKNRITMMLIGLRSDDWIPPVLFFAQKFGRERLDEFLRQLEYKFTSDWVCGITPTLRLDAMNMILKEIEKAETADQVLANQSLFAVSTRELRSSLEGNIYTKRYAKMLLLKIEYLLSDNTAQISDYGMISVEHVLPQTPREDSKWNQDFSQEEKEFWVHKLANLVLLNRKKNSALGNLDFEEKCKRYFSGKMDIFQANKVFLEKQKNWNVELLEKRQKELIDLLLEN